MRGVLRLLLVIILVFGLSLNSFSNICLDQLFAEGRTHVHSLAEFPSDANSHKTLSNQQDHSDHDGLCHISGTTDGIMISPFIAICDACFGDVGVISLEKEMSFARIPDGLVADLGLDFPPEIRPPKFLFSTQ